MSQLSDYTPFSFNADQDIAALLLQAFVHESKHNVFILKGHAGTGKTMLAGTLIKYLDSLNIPLVLLASTGRAAKIVSEKAGCMAETVHRHIFELDVEETDDENKIRRLVFRPRSNTAKENTVYIVDESSMISDHFTQGVFIDFGTGKLLTDFFRFTGNRKVIFLGDPCQLPPINTLFSPCFKEEYLYKNFGKSVNQVNLTKVMRFGDNSGISFNTQRLRETIASATFPYMKIKASGFSDIRVASGIDKMISDYVLSIHKVGVDNAIFLTYTNALALDINVRTRNLLFPGKIHIQKNELLMVVQNNYKYNLANGEHIVVTDVSNETEHRAGLTFLKISASFNDSDGCKIFTAFIIEDLLYSNAPSLDMEQEYNLYVDFIIRMKKVNITPRHPDFVSFIVADPYLNALRVKYGYAITCHKAQGGEWNDVYIALEKALFNPTAKENTFRWTYTAISRCISRLSLSPNLCIT